MSSYYSEQDKQRMHQYAQEYLRSLNKEIPQYSETELLVRRNAHRYICSYVKSQGLPYPTKCCPKTAHSINLDSPEIVSAWNYNIPRPTVAQLQSIPYSQVLLDAQMAWIQNNFNLRIRILANPNLTVEILVEEFVKNFGPDPWINNWQF